MIRIMHILQCRRKCSVDSILTSQLHNGLIVSWKLYLILCSLRWLKPSLNLMVNLRPLGLWQLSTEFGHGRMNFRILVFFRVSAKSGKSFSLIFPWFLPCFPWFNIGPEQIPHTTPISDNLNTYHYASLLKQTLAYLSKEVCFNFIMKKENQHLMKLQNKSTQFWKGLIMWKHFNFN